MEPYDQRKNEKPLKFSTYLLTKDKYTDFRLIFSAKLVTSEMHSGVAFWGANPIDPQSQADYFDSLYHATRVD